MNGESAAGPSVQRGKVLLEQGRYPEAEKYFREALASDPHDSQSLFHLALCQWQQEGKGKDAFETIKRAIGLDPNEGSFFALQALILTSLHRGREALLAAEKALALEPFSPFSFNAKAAAYMEMQQWAKAEEAAKEALALDPENSTASNQLAVALRLQGKLEQNADQIAFMLSRNPEDSHTHANAGWNALQRGDRKQAETHFLEALRLNAENEYARHGLIETFRARSPIYRAYLSYCFFMQRFTGAQQWAMIIGLVVVMKFSNTVFKGPYEIIGIGLSGLYMLFVLWVHVARSVGNFLLAIDRKARLALRANEFREGVIVGGSVTLGLAMFLAGLAGGWKPCFAVGFALVGAAFPFAYTFTNDSKVGKWLFGAFGVFVLAAGAVNLADLLAPELGLEALAGSMLTLAIFVVIGTTWLSNVPALRR